jgi:hypothetical protein
MLRVCPADRSGARWTILEAVVPMASSGGVQLPRRGFNVVNGDDWPVPTAGNRLGLIPHRPRCGVLRSAQPKLKIAGLRDRECRAHLCFEGESEQRNINSIARSTSEIK